VSRITPSLCEVSGEGNVPFQDIMEILRNKRKKNVVNAEINKFVELLGG